MKFIIRYNTGYGDNYEIAEVENLKEAEDYAYESWREDSESHADYEAMEYTDELKWWYLREGVRGYDENDGVGYWQSGLCVVGRFLGWART
jgi:hypothetical protein